MASWGEKTPPLFPTILDIKAEELRIEREAEARREDSNDRNAEAVPACEGQ